MAKVEVIGRTIEKDALNRDINVFNPDMIHQDAVLMSGRAAGICYMPDDYTSNGIKDVDKSIKRAAMNAKSGHYSVYEHFHVNLIIECSKMMAMILNSTRLYATSEKSARYTVMSPETEAERDMYGKWKGLFAKLIEEHYGDKLTEKEIEKLALENARYFISVWTPTTMEFTVPYGRLVLLTGWLRDYSVRAAEYTRSLNNDDTTSKFFERLSREAKELSDLFISEVGVVIDELEDHKNIGIPFIENIYYEDFDENWDIYSKDSNYSDSYTSIYSASFAALAQLERHRTITYSFRFFEKPFTITSFSPEYRFYIPKILDFNDGLRKEYLEDMKLLYIRFNVVSQGLLVKVCEQGRFEDFILKAKERLCARAQLEICNITNFQMINFYNNFINENIYINYVLKDKIDTENCAAKYRCQFDDFKCREGCKIKTAILTDRKI